MAVLALVAVLAQVAAVLALAAMLAQVAGVLAPAAVPGPVPAEETSVAPT